MKFANVYSDYYLPIMEETKELILQSAKQEMTENSYARFEENVASDVFPMNLTHADFKNVDAIKEFLTVVSETIGIGLANCLYDNINYSVA